MLHYFEDAIPLESNVEMKGGLNVCKMSTIVKDFRLDYRIDSIYTIGEMLF